MDKIFRNASDTEVAVRKIYTKSTDTFAYADSGCTIKLDADTLKDAFVKGAVIIGSDGTEYIPVSCKVEKKVATVTYVTTDTSTATTAKLATIKSE